MLFLVCLAGLASAIIVLSHFSNLILRWHSKREKQKNKPSAQHRAYSSTYPKHSNKNAISVRLQSLLHQIDSYKKEQQEQDTKKTRRDVITIIVITATAAFAFWSAWIFQGQLTAMQEDKRPWLRLSAPINPVQITVYDIAAFVTLDLKVRNIGHTPAENVFVWGKVYPEVSITDEASAAKSACQDALLQKLSFIQTMIFPDEERPVEENSFPIDIKEIEKSRIDYINEQYAGRVVMLGKERAETIRKQELAYPLSGVFRIAGCITYSYLNGRSAGQTAFILNVDRPCPESPVGKCAFNVSHPVDYGAKDILVTEVRRGLFVR